MITWSPLQTTDPEAIRAAKVIRSFAEKSVVIGVSLVAIGVFGTPSLATTTAAVTISLMFPNRSVLEKITLAAAIPLAAYGSPGLTAHGFPWEVAAFFPFMPWIVSSFDPY